MKIYADSSIDTSTPFDEFVGKDVWVRVQCTFGSKVIIYVRFIEKHIGALIDQYGPHIPIMFRCNWVLAQKYDDGRLHRLDYNVRSFAASDLKLLSPVTTLSSSELFGISDPDDKKTLEVFSRIAGKDLYVLVSNQDDILYYVKINSIQGNVINMDYIDESVVFGTDDYYDWWWDDSPFNHIRHDTIFSDKFTVIDPIDILTGEELNDTLTHLDEIYQQHADDLDHDEDDEEEEE